MKRGKEYMGSCVDNCFGSLLEKVIESGREIKQSTFLKQCDPGVETHSEMVEYPNDFRYYHGTGYWKKVFWYEHSKIEYFFS